VLASGSVAKALAMLLLGLPPMGLVVAVVVLTLIASLATGRFAWKESAALAVVLTLASWLVFVVLLKLRLPLWPLFAGG
jgi:hypothetical protein